MKSCKDITEMIEKEKVVGLSRREKMQVKLHLMVCKLCRNFSKDSDFLDKLLHKIRPKSLTLTAQERKQIKENLRD